MEFMHHEKWQDALFLHYEADPIALQALLPPGLVVDTHDNKAYVGVVALSEHGITPTPTFLPHWMRRLLSLSHDAVNVRTYVRPSVTGDDEQAGIYFFTLDCSHVLPAIGARLLFHLPYRLAKMTRRLLSRGGGETAYLFQSKRHGIHNKQSAQLEVEWKTEEQVIPQSSLASFFVERYSLYNQAGTFLRMLGVPFIWRGRIEHTPWPMQHVNEVTTLHNTLLSAVPGLEEAILSKEPIAHFSPGVNDIRFFFETMPTKTKSS